MQDPQENQKFSVQELATAIREKHPQYEGYSDLTVVNAFVEKYPEYKEKVDFGEPVKKKVDTESPSTGEAESTKSYPFSNRKEFISQFREQTGLTEKDMADGVVIYNAAKLYPELKDMFGVRTEGYEVDWDAESQKAYSKKRTVVESEPKEDYAEGNIIIDELDQDAWYSGMGRIHNRAIASSEIGKITSRSFYGGSIDFDELAYYSEVLEKNAGQNWMGSFGETGVGSFLADIMRTLPESAISLVDSSLSPEAAASSATGAAVGSFIPVVGTATGAAAGAAFAGSGMLTFGSTLLEKLREAGVDVTDAGELEKAWNDKDLLIPLAKESWAKAGMVGAFDAVSAGLGGTISKSAVKAGASKIAAEAREYAVEGALGGAGEAFGSLAAGDDVNMRDVALEFVADPAAGITGKGVKAVLGKNADADETKILDKLDDNKERTLKELKMSKLENAEKISENKNQIKELEGALAAAPKEQKKLINKEIQRLQKENTSIHANTLDEYSQYTDEEIEDMANDADEIIQLVNTIESKDMTTSQKEAVGKVVDNKAKALKDKRNKPKKGGINVSSTSRETGAPVRAQPEVAPAQEEFLQPDAAQGFEEFFDSQEEEITAVDEAQEADAFEELKAEMPELTTEDAPILVQKRVDNKGREVRTYSETVEDAGVQKTKYSSERDGEVVPTGGVVFTKETGFDKLLEAFNIPEEEFTEAVGDVEAVAMTASETDGTNGKVELVVKKEDGTFNISVPFIEAEVAAEAAPVPAPKKKAAKKKKKVVEEVDDSLSEEGKIVAQEMAKGMRAALDALTSKPAEEITEEEVDAVIKELGMEAPAAPDFPELPKSAYEDAFEADMSMMDAEDVAAIEEYFSGETKEVAMGLKYIKSVSDALKSSTGSKAVDKQTRDKMNSSLGKHLRDALASPKDFTKFIAENAMQGDMFTVGKAIYRIGEVTETKAKSTASKDVAVFKALKETGKTNVKDALNVLYNKIVSKEGSTITPKEEAILRDFEAGRFKGIKDKKVSIDDIISLLNVLEVTGKDGAAAVKQAYAMANDKKTVKQFMDLRKKLLDEYPLTDKNGQPVLKNGYPQIDTSSAPKQDVAKMYSLMKQVGKINKMKDFVSRASSGKFKEVVKKKGATPITKYMADRGIETSAGTGLTRTVKFQRYSRKTGEPLPTASQGKKKDVLGKKVEFREYKEEQYTATIKDGVLVRKAINSERITAAFGKMGSASYTRFREETQAGKAEKRSGAKFRRSQETRAKVSRSFDDGKTMSVLTMRPKNKSTLVGAIAKVFNLHKDKSEAAAEISDRLIRNMARRAGVKPSEIYDKITLVKNEFRGDLGNAEDIRSPRAVKTILRRFGAPISESNLDENGNPIDFTKLDQKATPITTDFKKYKQKGVEDSFTAQMIEDLKNLGINVMSMKGDIKSIIIELTQDTTSYLPFETRRIREAIGSRVSKKRLLDDSKVLSNKRIRNLVVNEIAAFYNMKAEDVDGDVLSQYEIQTGKSINSTLQEYATRTRGEQNSVAKKWLDWLDGLGDELDMGDITIEQYSKAFNLVNTALNFNYSLDNNPENKLIPRSSSTTENLTPFVYRIANEVLEGDGNNPIVDYSKSLASKTEETSKARIVKKNKDGTYWSKYKHTSGLSFNDAEAEVEALTFASQMTSWCTKNAAQTHLEGGDFHILFDKNGKPLTAIRQESDKIAEERGNTSDQGLIPKYDQHLIDYKKEGFVKGYNAENDSVALKRRIDEAKKSLDEDTLPYESSDYLNLYVLDIAESRNPEKALEEYKKKSDYFDDYYVAKEGVNIVFEDDKVIVPVGRQVILKPAESSTGRVSISELVTSDRSIIIEGSNDISIKEINQSPSSLRFSDKGYSPEIIVDYKGFEESKNFGDITRVSINTGVAAISFNEGIGAAEVVEGRMAWVTDISFRDNIKRNGRRYRSFAEIPDRRNASRVITYSPEVFDKEGYFAGVAYDESWGDGARILNQEAESQLNKEDFLNTYLRGPAGENLNRFKTKKAANEFIKKHKKNNPALKFNPIKKSMGIDAGMWFIDIQRNPKYKLERKVDNTVRAAIALVDGEAVIYALTNPNVSSVVHEMSHMYEDYLTPAEVKTLEKWGGSKRGTVDFSEKFARGFERFLADGKAPTPELKSIFSQFKEWMKSIYKAIVGSPIEKDITPEVREIFENMVMVEGDVNFRETGFKTGDIVGPVKGGVKLNQEAAKSGMQKLEEVNSNSKKMIAVSNETKDNKGKWGLFKKTWSDRQSTIRKYMKDRGLVLAESAMNARAGAGARAKYKVEAVAKKIYDGLSAAQEDILNMYLQAERIIQIENNREAKRDYAQGKLNEFVAKKNALLEAVKGREYSTADKKVIEESIQKIDTVIAKAQEMVNKNRLYKLDKNGIETGELAFKHPNGMTKEDAQAAIQKMAERPDFAVIKRRGEIYFDAMSENLKDLYEGGVIDKATYDRFKNDKYISRAFLSHIFDFQQDAEGQVIKTNFDDNADFYESIGLGVDQIRALAEGSEGELIMNSRYLLEKSYQSASARVLKNKAAAALAKEMNGKSATWYKDPVYKTRNGEIVEDRFGNYDALTSEGSGFKTVYYRDGGKKRAFYLDNESFNEWNDLDLKIERNFGMSTLRMMSGTGLLKAAATGANPLFFLVNVPMDIAHVLFFTDVYDNNKIMPVNFAKVSSKITRNISGILGLDIDSSDVIRVNRDTANTRRTKKLLDIYFENGGGMDFMTQQGQQLFDEQGNMITNKSRRQKLGAFLGYTGNVTELAMRLATVEQVVSKLSKDRSKGKNNYSDAEINQMAVSKARAVMDFSQGGIRTKKLDMFVPYLNAAVQAFRVTREYLSTPKGRANFANKWSQASIGIAMITFYNLMMSESDEEDDTLYDDIPDYIKDNYFVFILPFQKRDADGKVKYVRIRKSPNVAPFLNLSEAIARATYYSMKGIDDPRKGVSTVSQFKRAQEQIATMLPFAPSGYGLVSKLPPTVQAAVKYVANYDPFRQMNIVPENEFKKVSEGKEGAYDERVPVFLKAIGEATGLSPKRSQAVIESFVTSPSTNFIVGGAYSILDKGANLIGDYEGAKQSRYTNGFVKSIFGSGMERVVRDTNPNWRKYTYDKAQDIKQEEGDINQQIKGEISFYSKEFRDAKTQEQKQSAIQEFKEFAMTLKVPADRKRAMEQFRERISRDWSKVKNVDEALSIKYAGDPEASAKTYDLYFGVPDLRTKKGSDEINEQIKYLRQNFGFKPSARFRDEIYRISKEKYKY